MKTTTPQSPHEEFTQKHEAWRAATTRVQPLTRDQWLANIAAAQRQADTAGKAARVAKAKAQTAASAKMAAKHNR